jgi:hypothetical protein
MISSVSCIGDVATWIESSESKAERSDRCGFTVRKSLAGLMGLKYC